MNTYVRNLLGHILVQSAVWVASPSHILEDSSLDPNVPSTISVSSISSSLSPFPFFFLFFGFCSKDGGVDSIRIEDMDLDSRRLTLEPDDADALVIKHSLCLDWVPLPHWLLQSLHAPQEAQLPRT